MDVPAVDNYTLRPFGQHKLKSDIEKLPLEVSVMILQRLNWRDLVHFSYTSKTNHWTVLNTPKLLHDLFSEQILEFGSREIAKLTLTDNDTILPWQFSIALGIRNPEHGLEWGKKYLNASVLASCLQRIAKKINRSEAIWVLVRGAEEVRKGLPFNWTNKYLTLYTRQLAALDCQKALEICEMIDDVSEKNSAKISVFQYLPEMQKKAFFDDFVLSLDFSMMNIDVLVDVLKGLTSTASFPSMKLLIEKALEVSFGSGRTYYVPFLIKKMASPLFKENPKWVLSIIENISDVHFQIEAHCELATVRFPDEPEKAKEHVKKAIHLSTQNSDKSRDYEKIADTLCIWDKAQAEMYYRMAIEQKTTLKDYNCWMLEDTIKKLSKINLEAALQNVEPIVEEYEKGINLCNIGLECSNKALYEKGIDHILKSQDGDQTYFSICSWQVSVFGEEFAITSAYRLTDVKFRAQELLRIAKRIIYVDPQTARKLIKDALSISIGMEDRKTFITNLIQFIDPESW